MPVKFDNLLQQIGGFGHYQKICLSMTSIGALLMGVASQIVVLVLATPKHNCAEIEQNSTIISYNTSITNDDSTDSFNSLATELDLICDRGAKYKILIETSYMIGSLAGCLTLYLSDKYGRALTSFISCLLMGICFNILPLSGQLPVPLAKLNSKQFTVYFYSFWNFLLGLSQRFQLMVTYIYTNEITQQSRQSLSGAYTNGFYPFGAIVMAILSIFVNDWRDLMRIFGYLALGYLPFRWYYFEKSPKYLLSSSPGEEGVQSCYDVMMKIASKNKQKVWMPNSSSAESDSLSALNLNQEFMLEQLRQIKNSETDPRNTNPQAKNKNIFAFTIIFKSGYYMGRTTVIICYIWGVTYTIFMGQTLSLGKLPGGLTGSIIIAASSDLFAAFSYEKLMDLPWLGRRGTLISANFIVGVCLILKSIVVTNDMIILTLAFTARIANYMVWCIIIHYSNEAYPTEFLATAIGFLNIMASFMAVSSPSVLSLKTSVGWITPSVVFGVASLGSSILARYLPETLKSVENGSHKVVELITLEDAVDFYEDQLGNE